MTMSKTQRRLYAAGACAAAIEWVGNRTWAQAWQECPRGDWLLWLLEKRGVDCSKAGFWCAERARQHALRALPPSPERDALERGAATVDAATAGWGWAGAAAGAAARAAAWEAAWEAEAAARAAEAAEAAAWRAARVAVAAAAEARAAEYARVADYVRAHYKRPKAPDRATKYLK